ncbi:hypothetical protein MY1884_009730 [Beauveria asiatica]
MSSELPDQHCVKRRRRPAKSCDACRARKVRCDQKIPRGPCTKARSAPKCIYGPDTVRLPCPDPSPETSGSGVAAPHTPAKIRHYTPEASSLSGKTEAEQLRRQITRLQNRVVRLESRLETDAIKAGSVGAEDVELSFETPKMDFAKIRQELTKRRLTIKQFEMPVLNDPIADILATIPMRAECDALVDIYMSTYERIYRVLHIPTFYQQYDSFWKDRATSSSSFRMKLVLILALGSTLGEDINECALADRQTRTWTYAAQWWLTGPTEKSTFNLDGMQIACLLQLVRQMTAVGRAWVSRGTVIGHMNSVD